MYIYRLMFFKIIFVNCIRLSKGQIIKQNPKQKLSTSTKTITAQNTKQDE